MKRLNGRAAIVTGGSRGIGAAIAARLVEDGARAAITYRNDARAAEEVVESCRAHGGECIAIAADVADPAAMAAAFDRVIAEFGRLDILVNNAGIAEFLPLDRVTPEHFDRVFDVDVRGLLFATQEAARRMADGGRIINITSGSAEAAGPGTSVYSAAKAAVQVMSRSWAAELGARGITVNCVSPGITETDMLREVMPAGVIEALRGQTALRRVGRPEDIADVVAFLASEDARWITRQTIGVNGGLS